MSDKQITGTAPKLGAVAGSAKSPRAVMRAQIKWAKSSARLAKKRKLYDLAWAWRWRAEALEECLRLLKGHRLVQNT